MLFSLKRLSCGKRLTSHVLPDDKFLALSEFKAFADDYFDAAQMVHFFFLHRVENSMEIGVNDGYQIFFFSHNFFNRLLFQCC